MNRTVLFGTLLLALAAVPALPSAVAYDPCVKTTCVLVDDELPWLCVGANHQWEAYGACADVDPACVGTRSGRLWQEYCAPLEAPAALPALPTCDTVQTCPVYGADLQNGRACAGIRFGTGAAVTCIFADAGCVRQHWGYAYNDVCLDGTGLERLIVWPAALPSLKHLCDQLACQHYGPIVQIDDDRACAGVALGYGGTKTCVLPEKGCVQQHWGYAYAEHCVAAIGIQDIVVLP